MESIAGKRVVITGATSGIGQETATRLAALGARVVLACRDTRRGELVADTIRARAGRESATAMELDTSDASSIQAFGAAYRSAYGSLDVLVNNAGVLLTSRETSVDGVELTFATNVLGYFLVTTELLDALGAAPAARVVNVASEFAGHVDLEDLEFNRRTYDGMAAYAQSKACDRMLSWTFARRLSGHSVTVNAMLPGLMLGTRLYRQLPKDALRQLEQLGGRTVGEGADTVVWLASSPDVEGVSGRFFAQRAEIACEFRDEEAEERLWEACERIANQLQPQH
jgi:NAD(P)-dependent dehydrogenase (short-subunit alcohol dehydrogenase family)